MLRCTQRAIVDEGVLIVSVHSAFESVLEASARAACVAVDMPIGLLDAATSGGREADRAARRLLGRRGVSVFSPPARPDLGALTFDEVRGRGVTLQGFHLLPKIREVDAALAPSMQQRVVEAHPELAFARLAGGALHSNKRSEAGRQARLAALRRHAAFEHLDSRRLDGLRTPHRRHVAADDLLDALALTVTAERLLSGSAQRLPPAPSLDARGLRMEIWY